VAERVRLAEVAAYAGVSVATASAVARGLVDGNIRVGEDTRRRVEEAIAQLGYRPNAAARALRTRRTGMVGLVVPDVTNPIFPQIIRAAQIEAEKSDLVVATWDSSNDRRRELAALDAILDRQLDGAVLVTDYLATGDLSPLVDAGVAVAATDERLEMPGVDLVSEDLAGGARDAVGHLIDRGHRRIAHISGPAESTVAGGRRDGYLAALGEAGLDVDPELIVGGGFDRETGHKATLELLDMQSPPTAVFAVNDTVAIGVLHACSGRGIQVPEEMAVIGVDNTPEADAVIPGLTTMDVRPAEVGQRLIDAVVSRREATRSLSSRREIILPALVRRNTT